jgi:hypothetical protein
MTEVFTLSLKAFIPRGTQAFSSSL